MNKKIAVTYFYCKELCKKKDICKVIAHHNDFRPKIVLKKINYPYDCIEIKCFDYEEVNCINI